MTTDENTLVIKLKKQTIIIPLVVVFLALIFFFATKRWSDFILFLILTLFIIKQNLLNSRALTLTSNGLSIGTKKQALFFKWSDIEKFERKKSGGLFSKSNRIGFNVISSYSSKRFINKISRKLSGFDFEIGSGYELNTEELLNMLQEWQKRFSHDADQHEVAVSPESSIASGRMLVVDYKFTGSGRMIDAKERETLNSGTKVIWIIWAAMFVSLGIYVILGHTVIAKTKMIGMSPDDFSTLRNISYIIAVIGLAANPFMRKIMLNTPLKGTLSSAAPQIPGIATHHPALGKYTTVTIVSLALAESIAVSGLLLLLIDKDFQSFYLLTAISAAAMIVYRPKIEEVEKLALALKASETNRAL